MTVAEYVIQRIAKETDHVFMVVGGGGVFLYDELGKHPTLKYVCNHHEQASAMAAEAYARITGNLGVCMVSTGPAGINALTGVACAWTDSIPMLIITCQANSKSLMTYNEQRQTGVHEANIAAIAAPITKYATCLKSVGEVETDLEYAIHLAKYGRKGPVLIDIPIDIQNMEIELKGLSYEQHTQIPFIRTHNAPMMWDKPFNKPVIIVGHGVRLSNAIDDVITFSAQYHIPIVTTKNGFDSIHDDFPNLIGRMGINGQLRANKVVQQADCLIILGSRLSAPTTGYNRELFAPNAMKIIVDIDINTIEYLMGIFKDVVYIQSDIKAFLKIEHILNDFTPWLETCKAVKKQYPVIADSSYALQDNSPFINPYIFYERLSDYTKATDIIIADQGAAFYCQTVALKLKKGQRAFTNGGFSPMGYGLPAAIGAAFASGNRVICVVGDGGLQMNIQELQTIRHHKLPIIIFVLNNNGYLSIKHTQNNLCEGRFMGSTLDSGLSFPDLRDLAKTYKMDFYRLNIPCPSYSFHEYLNNIMNMYKGVPTIIQVDMDPFEPFTPKVVSYKDENGQMVSPALDDMR